MLKIIITFFLLFWIIGVKAQDSGSVIVNKTNNSLGNGLYLNPIQLVFGEVLLSYEHFLINNNSVGFSLGYKFPTAGKNNEVESFGHGMAPLGDYEYQYMLNRNLSAVYFSLQGFNYVGNKGYYLSLEIFDRYYWMDDQRLHYSDFGSKGSQDFVTSRTERINVVGLNINIGRKFKMVSFDKSSLVFDLYCGMTFRYKYYQYKNEDMLYDNNYIEYSEESGNAFYPFINVGFKMGLATFNKQ